MKPHFIPLFFALSVTLSAAAATPCAENTVCAQTNTIEGHGFPTDMPEWDDAPSESNTIGAGDISVRPIQDLDPDGDEVVADSKTYQWCNEQGECFANSPTLTINPSDIDKVFDKGVGFKPLTVRYSGKVKKGYPENTREFTSDVREFYLEYPADFTDGICYEVPGGVVQTMVLNVSSGQEVTHHLEFPQMALDTLPGKLSMKASSSAVGFKPEIVGMKLKFQQKALPDVLEVRYSNGFATPKKFLVNKVSPGGYGAPIIYSFIGAVTVNGITVTNFSFVLNTQDIDYRKYMSACNEFNTP